MEHDQKRAALGQGDESLRDEVVLPATKSGNDVAAREAERQR